MEWLQFKIKNKQGLGVAIHTYNPCCAGNRGKRMVAQGWPEQNAQNPI
jgi:hypothetical protein